MKGEYFGAIAVFLVWLVSILAALGLPIVLIWAVIRLVMRFT
jgi:hypothetical protein